MSFSIGNRGYVGTGAGVTASNLNEFWEYDSSTDTWIQKASFGVKRKSGAAFSIGLKGYIGTGADSVGFRNDFWEWDQITNTWTQKASLPALPRCWAAGFSISNKGYIGTGLGTLGLYSDFWEWDQLSNTWTQVASFGGGLRCETAHFSIGNNGYVGTGSDINGNYVNDFWEFTPPGATDIKEPTPSLQTTIYPNPFTTSATIEINSPLEWGKGCVFILYDTQGRQVRQLSIVNSQLTIQRDNLPSGVYFYSVVSDGKTLSTGKIIAQ